MNFNIRIYVTSSEKTFYFQFNALHINKLCTSVYSFTGATCFLVNLLERSHTFSSLSVEADTVVFVIMKSTKGVVTAFVKNK